MLTDSAHRFGAHAALRTFGLEKLAAPISVPLGLEAAAKARPTQMLAGAQQRAMQALHANAQGKPLVGNAGLLEQLGQMGHADLDRVLQNVHAPVQTAQRSGFAPALPRVFG